MDSIKVKVLETIDCIPADKKAYVGYVVLSTNFSNQQMKSKSSSKEKAPSFNQEFSFLLPSEKKEKSLSLIVKVYEKEHWPKSDSLLGETTISLNESKDDCFKLESPKKKEENGKIHIVITIPDGIKKASTEVQKKFDEVYSKGEKLGEGAFSIVYKGTRKSDNKVVAIKCVNKVGQSPDVIKLLKREISVMQKLHNPNIVCLLDVYENDESITMVLEYVDGGELYDHIIERGSYSEKEAADITAQLLSALSYMHENGVAHRDLKPENLLCEKGSNVVKIADFGLSKDFSMASVMQTCCGSPSYVSPEVLSGGVYDTSCDVWSLGVITYVLLSGYLPFFADTQPELFDKIMEGSFEFSQPIWENISDEAKDFVTQCLILDASSRPSAAQLLKHPWIANRSKGRTTKLNTVASMADLRSGFNPKSRGKS